MPTDLNLALDFPYNEKLRERNRLLSKMDLIQHNPIMLGGGRLRDFVLPGQNGAYPLDRVRLMELQSMGGALGGINRYKKASKWLGFTTKALTSGLDLASKAKALSGNGELAKKVRRVKKVLADPLVQEVLAEPVVQKVIARAKKASVVKEVVSKVKKIVGGAKTKRLVKGSPEAKAHMARIRAMRK